MKSRIIITWIASIAISPCMLVAAPAEKQEQESAVNIAAQLQDIDKYISQSRKRTEEYFVKKLDDLKVQAEKDAELFEQSQRDELAEIEAAKRSRFRRRHGRYPRKSMMSGEQVALVENRIVEKKELIKRNLERSIATLERQKKHVLNISLVDLEKRSKDSIHNKPEPTHGVVFGIVYSKDKPLALVDKHIVSQGDILHGIKITKILRNSVEFEKNGKTWKQGPGQSPDKFNWQE